MKQAPLSESEVEGFLYTAARRPIAEPRDASPLPPILTIPDSLSGEEIGEFLIALSRRKPRQMRKLVKAMAWLDEEGQKAKVW